MCFTLRNVQQLSTVDMWQPGVSALLTYLDKLLLNNHCADICKALVRKEIGAYIH